MRVDGSVRLLGFLGDETKDIIGAEVCVWEEDGGGYRTHTHTHQAQIKPVSSEFSAVDKLNGYRLPRVAGIE